MQRTGLAAAVERLEMSGRPWPWLLVSWLAFVLLRNIIEGALGPTHMIGFTPLAAESSLMVLDHFVLFYASVFLSITLVLSLLTGERADRVVRASIPAWIIVLLPPLLDFLVTSGAGYHISYVLGLDGVLLTFFDPRVAIERISPGQRVEVALACLLASAYVAVKTRSWWRTPAAFVLVYLVIGLHGVLPSVFARLAWWMRYGLAGAAAPEALTAAGGYAGAAAAAAYDAAFRSGGIVVEESRKLALLFLVVATALGWIVYRRAAPRSEAAFRRGFRPLRAFHYMGMTTFGVAFGWMLFVGEGVRLGTGGDTLGILGSILATLFAFLSSVSLNDLCDEEADRISGEERPLALGKASRRQVRNEGIIFAALSLLYAINVGYVTFLLVLLCLGISFLYSSPPVRLKRVPVVSTLLLGLMSYLAALVGFSALAGEHAMALFPSTVGWLLVLSFAAAFTVKDLKDIEGDRATGTVTIPVLFGPRAGRLIVAGLVLAAYFLAPALLPYGLLIWPALFLGIASAVVVLLSEHRREDGLLLTAYLGFAFLVALLIVGNPETVMPEREPRAKARGAELRARRAEAFGEWTGAADGYGTAVAALATPAPDLLVRAGVAAYRAGRHEDAVRHLGRALTHDPTSPVAREYLMAAEIVRGETGRALAIAAESADMGIAPASFRVHEGDLAAESGHARRAVRAYEAALRLGAPAAETRVRLASQLESMGQVERAEDELEAAALVSPRTAAVADALGRFRLRCGDPSDAVAHLMLATELEPGHALFWNNLGAALRMTGAPEQALAVLGRAIELDPGLADAYYNRGLAYEALGRADDAMREYLLAMETDPAFAPARQRIGALSAQ